MEAEKISCCGMICNECPVYIASLRNDDSMKRFLAHEYSAGGQVFYPKDIDCRGCHSELADHNKFGKDCEIRKCCREKQIRLCAECKDYPCGKAEKYIPEGTEQRCRLEEMHGVWEKL